MFLPTLVPPELVDQVADDQVTVIEFGPTGNLPIFKRWSGFLMRMKVQ